MRQLGTLLWQIIQTPETIKNNVFIIFNFSSAIRVLLEIIAFFIIMVSVDLKGVFNNAIQNRNILKCCRMGESSYTSTHQKFFIIETATKIYFQSSSNFMLTKS